MIDGNQNKNPENDDFYVNKYGGYLLRVKPALSDEGGVAAGYAVLSSPDLVSEILDNDD